MAITQLKMRISWNSSRSSHRLQYGPRLSNGFSRKSSKIRK